MPVIIPSEDFSDISKLFDMTQKIQEPIFITKKWLQWSGGNEQWIIW